MVGTGTPRPVINTLATQQLNSHYSYRSNGVGGGERVTETPGKGDGGEWQ